MCLKPIQSPRNISLADFFRSNEEWAMNFLKIYCFLNAQTLLRQKTRFIEPVKLRKIETDPSKQDIQQEGKIWKIQTKVIIIEYTVALI